jgi:streptogramin lyase
MRTSAAILFSTILSAFGLACGGNGASGPVVSVSPATFVVSTGDGATSFQVTLSNGAVDPVAWTLTGPGSISTTTGRQTSYLPPALGQGGGTAMLKATAPCGTGCVPVADVATITVNTATTGTLTVNVQIAGAGPASLTVAGPNGFNQSLSTSSSVVLPGLAPGNYTVTAADVITTDPIVNSKSSAPPASVMVVANAAASVTLTYVSQPGYGMLWTVGATVDSLDGFASGDLTVQKTPSATPTTGGAVQGIAFDAAGNMWASLKGPDSVVSYAPAGLANTGPPPLVATVTLSDANISDPAGVAIGPDGRMWVANCGTNSIAAYPLLGGSASVVISSLSGTVFKCPRGIAFDSAGNLWVANRDGVASRIPSIQLTATNNAASPDVSLAPPASSSQPYGVAIDATGNVWVSFCQGSMVARYNASGLPGTTTPAVSLGPVAAANPRTLDCPVALALDNSGQLWVANEGTDAGPTLSGFGTADMGTSGTPSPIVELTGTGATVGGLAFNPTASNLPLRH